MGLFSNSVHFTQACIPYHSHGKETSKPFSMFSWLLLETSMAKASLKSTHAYKSRNTLKRAQIVILICAGCAEDCQHSLVPCALAGPFKAKLALTAFKPISLPLNLEGQVVVLSNGFFGCQTYGFQVSGMALFLVCCQLSFLSIIWISMLYCRFLGFLSFSAGIEGLVSHSPTVYDFIIHQGFHVSILCGCLCSCMKAPPFRKSIVGISITQILGFHSYILTSEGSWFLLLYAWFQWSFKVSWMQFLATFRPNACLFYLQLITALFSCFHVLLLNLSGFFFGCFFFP
ncbi:uncharacterized protein LOC120104259 [Phoenix dactylifera]|uniref:Uncharacterized protein LOC120104259 n=1 Tax=Phoenix dactylifera TaxID=42345 RepID=A0A8B8ZAH5_PHODC|nr:uncharacterized protein LOC120104259 [Phoenix dactylifera]